MRMCMMPALGLAVMVIAGQATALEPNKIVEKAIKAHGGEKLLKSMENKAGRSLAKGKMFKPIEGDLTVETWYAPGDKLKVVTDITFMGTDITTTQVFNGDNAWIVVSVGGQTMEVDLGEDFGKEVKEQLYQEGMAGLVILKKPGIKLSPLGEGTVDGKATVGLRASSEGHRDVNLHFDKESGLLVKMEAVVVDFQTQAEVTQERVFKEYHKVKGVYQPKKVSIKQDGDELMDFEVLEIEILDKIDDSEFSKP